MKFYVSGPMRGYPDTNFPMFDEVSRYIRSCSDENLDPWVPLSPADNDRRVWPEVEQSEGFAAGVHPEGTEFPPGFSFPELFTWDVGAIGEADGIVLLPGWEASVGAVLELAVAEAFGKTVLFAVIEDGKCVYIQPADPKAPELIGLMGYAQSGKDTAAAALIKQGYRRVAFADALRDMLYAINPITHIEQDHLNWQCIDEIRLQYVVDRHGWDFAKQVLPEVRELLQRLGTEAGRKVLGDGIWVDTAMAKVKPGGKYVITDVRFPNEAEAIRAAGGQLIRIIRPGCGPVNNHPSETALDGLEADVTVNNFSTIEVLEREIVRAAR